MNATDVESTLRRLSKALEARTEEILDAIAVRLRDEVPELDAAEQPEMWEPWREGTRASLLAFLGGVAGSREPPPRAPAAAVESAQLSARAGTPLPVLTRAYRTGHAVVWEFWLDTVEELVREAGLRRVVLQVGSRFMFRYIERLTALITQAYTEEHARSRRSSEQQRERAVRDLLAGAHLNGRALGYPLEVEHLGVVAWGTQAEQAVRELADATASKTLIVPVARGTVWGWLGGETGVRARALRAIARFRPAEGTAVALGDPAAGVEGFRRTHREARLAHTVALKRGRPVTRYDEVALEALAMQDEPLAREFVLRELGDLSTSEARTELLRETLLRYFAASQNAAAAAAVLGVHERTVANRLRAVEDLMGRSVGARRAEMETALRLWALFADDLADAPDRGEDVKLQG